MTRRRHRGSRRPGLFAWTPAGDTTTDAEPGDNPLTRTCPHCHAAIGHPCTRIGRRSHRQPIRGYHDSRQHQENP